MRPIRAVDLIRRVFASEGFWLAVYLVTAGIASAVCVERRCNNFLIFRSAFDHLRVGVDLYALHPGEHADLFKYSPTFALLFAPFALLPFSVAITAWNLLTVTAVFSAVRLAIDPRHRLMVLQLTGLGLITTIDGTQTNGVIAALILFAFAALERDRSGRAAIAIASGTLIKLFPAAALAFALPRKDRWRFGVFFALAIVGLIALPLLATSFTTLIAQYRSWYSMGSVDALDRGASVMRLLHELVGYEGPNWPVQLAGTLLLLLPLARGAWKDPVHRQTFLASLLVYSVIFNHKAEQPSYIIAIVGTAIWYATGARGLAKSLTTAVVFISTIPVFIWVAIPQLGNPMLPLEITAAACVAAWTGIQLDLLELAPVPSTALTPEMQPAD